jgi:pimeloyl-ACP methyl ester carboxylesterase
MKLFAALLCAFASIAQASPAKTTVVLVHGAFADGSSWSKVIPILEKDGYNVIAVQNPLTSLPDDVATTKRVIDAQKGPVVVVGHSYGGAVITDAAAANPNVKSLVYVAAFAPDAGEAVPAGARSFRRQRSARLSSRMLPDSSTLIARSFMMSSVKTCRQPRLALWRPRRNR